MFSFSHCKTILVQFFFFFFFYKYKSFSTLTPSLDGRDLMSCMDSYWTGCATLWPGSLLSLDWYKASITYWVWSNSTSIEDGHAWLNLQQILLWFHWHRDTFQWLMLMCFAVVICLQMKFYEQSDAGCFYLHFFLSDICLWTIWSLNLE